jgi:error-prone DNA polymerase
VEALPQPAIRLGLRLIRGISEDCARRIVVAREARPFRDVADLVARAALDRFERERLAEAGALRTLAGHRHRAFWAVAACDASPDHRSTPIAAHAATVPPRDHPAHPIAAHAAPTVPPGTPPPVDLLQEATIHEQRVTLRPPSAADDVFADYATTGLTLNRHPVALVRRQLAARRIRRSDELATLAHGTRIRCAGLVTLRQRPQTASGVTFLTLEDEHGLVNVVVWRDLAVRQRRELLESRLLGIDGVLETQDGVQHLIAKRLSDLTPLLDGLDARSRDFH